MSTPHRGTPVLCSNDPDDFIAGGGLYPGGTGIFKSIGYTFWDYNGTRAPNSQVAVKVTFSPTDGSNEGKDEDIFWSVGPATEYQPDQTGGFVFAIGGAAQIRDSCNWHFVDAKFKTNCGMPGGTLNGPTGIKILEGCQVTLVRQDQPDRNIERGPSPQGPVIPGMAPKQFNNKPTILVPTHGIFPWSAGGTVAGAAAGSTAAKVAAAKAKRGAAAAPAAAPATAPAPAPVAAAPAPVPVAAAAAAPAPVMNGAPAPPGGAVDDATLGGLIRDLLTNAAGNAIEYKDLPMLLTEKLGAGGLQVTAPNRIAILKQVKQPDFMQGLAAAHAFTFDGEYLAV